MFEILFGLGVAIASGLIGFKADHWSGNGKKLQGMLAIGLAIALPVWAGLALKWGLLSASPIISLAWMAGSYFLCIVAGLCLRRWMLWGATFMHDDRGPREEKHLFIYSWAGKITKFKWETCTNQELVILKMTMWMVGHATWGIPAAALIGISNLTIMPYFIVILIGLVRAYIYRLEFLQDRRTQLREGEPDAGMATYSLLALSRL